MYPNCSKSQEVQVIYDIFRICDPFAPPPLEEFSSTDPFPIVHFYYLENQENEEIKLVLKAFWFPIFMKLSGKLLLDVIIHLRPSPGASETSKSSKSPGRDQEEGGVWWWSQIEKNILEKLPWKFHEDWITETLSRLHLSSKSLPGVLEDVEVPDAPGDGLRWMRTS